MSKPSPFEQVHLQLGAQMAEYNGWRLPSRYGDVRLETQAMLNHCVAIDLSGFGRIALSGPGAEQLMARMGLSNFPQRGSEQWLWTRNGVTDSHRIAAYKSDYLLLSRPGQGSISEIQAIISDYNIDAQTIDLSEKTAYLGLYGPSAYNSVSKLLPFEIDELEPGSIMQTSFFMMNFTILRGSWLGQDGLELICPVSAAGLIGGAIAKYRQKYNITPAGMDCLLAAMQKT